MFTTIFWERKSRIVEQSIPIPVQTGARNRVILTCWPYKKVILTPRVFYDVHYSIHGCNMHVNVCSRNAFWICSRATTSFLCPDSSRCFNDCFNSITLCSYPLFVYLQPFFICSQPLFGFPFFICSHPNLLLTSSFWISLFWSKELP